jgi:hypothetical protein
MKTILVVCLILLSSAPIVAQDYTFKVLVNKGNNEIKSANGWQPVKVGAALKPTDEIKIVANAYLGLVHSTGKPLELKQSGSFKVSELAKQIGGGTNVLNKYTDFILSSNSGPKGGNLSATGAVHRGTTNIKVYLPKGANNSVMGSTVYLNWDNDFPGPYEVVIQNLFGESLASYSTKETAYNISLDDPKLKEEEVFLVKVINTRDKTKSSDEYTFKRASKANKQKLETSFQEILSSTSEPSALNKFIHAGFFEEQKYLIDATSAYQEAIKLAPDVQAYKEAYTEFLIRNNMAEAPVKKKP